MYPVPIGSGLGEIRGLIFLTRGSTEARLRDTFHGTMGSIERWQDSGGSKMTAIMSIHEPRPRGTALGERADRRPVREVEHFFRCKTC